SCFWSPDSLVRPVLPSVRARRSSDLAAHSDDGGVAGPGDDGSTDRFARSRLLRLEQGLVGLVEVLPDLVQLRPHDLVLDARAVGDRKSTRLNSVTFRSRMPSSA